MTSNLKIYSENYLSTPTQTIVNGTNSNNGYFSNKYTDPSTTCGTEIKSRILIENIEDTFKIKNDFTGDSNTSDVIYKQTYTNDFIVSIHANVTEPHISVTNSAIGSAFEQFDLTKHTLIDPNNNYSYPETHYIECMSSEEIQKKTKREHIKNNLKINIKSRADLIRNVPENEQRAIETLREELTETEFRKYIKYGFVLVKGQKGNTYQIYRNQDHTKVWKNGKVIEEICVRIKGYRIPPTDNVIAFLNMVRIDEEEFRKIGNVYNMRNVA